MTGVVCVFDKEECVGWRLLLLMRGRSSFSPWWDSGTPQTVFANRGMKVGTQQSDWVEHQRKTIG